MMTQREGPELDYKSGDDPAAIFYGRVAGRVSFRAVLRDHLNLKNIVVGLGLLTGLVVLASAASLKIAVLAAALFVFGFFIVLEMQARRRWEHDIIEQMRHMGRNFDRLIREVARNRNEVAHLKKALADAGEMARRYDRKEKKGTTVGDIASEQRMVKTIAEQLAQIDGRLQGRKAVTRDVEAQLSAMPDVTAENAAHVLTDEHVIQLVHQAVAADWVDLFLQPIVNLPQRKIRFFEMFSRIRIKDEIYLPAERYIAVAMQHDLLPVIDNLLLLRVLQFIRDTAKEDANRAWFCNITSLTLNDPKFMGDLVEFIAQNRTLAPRLVFEMAQHDLATMNPDALPVLDGLSHLGCRFSMDQVREMAFDFDHLEARHIRFVKVDAGAVVQELRRSGGLPRMKRLKASLDQRGIDLIVEKVESDTDLIELLDIEIDYGQGYLFGKPERDHVLLEVKS